jgi:serine/threonine protein kinase
MNPSPPSHATTGNINEAPQKIKSIVSARNTAETRNACPTLHAHQFELLRTLGTGTFARVWLVRPKREYRTSGTEFYALKVLKKKDGKVLRIALVNTLDKTNYGRYSGQAQTG